MIAIELSNRLDEVFVGIGRLEYGDKSVGVCAHGDRARALHALSAEVARIRGLFRRWQALCEGFQSMQSFQTPTPVVLSEVTSDGDASRGA